MPEPVPAPEPGATAPGSGSGQALLEARNLAKRYGQVRALDGASFAVFPGEVVKSVYVSSCSS